MKMFAKLTAILLLSMSLGLLAACGDVGNGDDGGGGGGGGGGTKPKAPSGLTAATASASQINLAWTDNADNEDGFKIERSSNKMKAYVQVATVGEDVSSYQNTGLAADTTYSYRIRAYNKKGNSGYSNEASATTQPTPTLPPTPPSGLTATAVSTTEIDLVWVDNSNNEESFKIERKTGAGGVYAEIDTVAAGVTTYQNTGLAHSTQFFYQVRAWNSAGNSAYSNEDDATTFVPSACSDGIDNDGDTLTDYPADYGCYSGNDNSEAFQSVDNYPAEINSASSDGGNYITQDGLIFYFQSDRPGGSGGWDIWYATRASTANPFNTPVRMTSLSTSANEGDPWLSDDGLRVYFDRTGYLYTASRTTLIDSFGAATAITELNSGGEASASSLSPDELTIFFSSNRAGGSGTFDVWSATRGSVGSSFSAPASVPGINTANHEVGPCISRDMLQLFFGSNRAPSVDYDIWFSSRPNTSSAWSTPVRVVELSTANAESPSVGCTNYEPLFFYVRGKGGSSWGINYAER